MGMITIEGLSHTYNPEAGQPITALRDIHLTLEPGTYVAIIGRNGSGKSTLARHLNALLLPTSGRVLVDGMDTRDPQRTWEIRQRVGMVFQDPDNQMVATVVEEDVAFGPENLGLPRAEIQRRVQQAMEMVGMVEHRHRPPHLLSAGQRQRVAIAGILAMAPRYLVLDEATAMLDPQGRRAVLDIVRQLHQAGMTIIHITHFMEEAAEAQRVVVIHSGQIAMAGTTREVFAQVDRLREWGLDAPPATHLATRIHRLYPAFRSDLLTADEVTQAVLHQIQFSRRPHQAAVRAQRTVGPSSVGDDRRAESDVLIRVENLHFTYMAGTPLATTALQEVNLTVGAGEIVGLIGPTGSGKSTLLQHLNGLLRPQAGRVLVAGLDLSDPHLDLREVRRKVGLVFQQPEDQLFEQYVGDDIAFGPRALGLSLDEQRERVRWAMSAVGLDFEAFKDRLTFTLSGGERRKVALAGVLALRPQILVLDEPTAGLDPASHREFLDWLLQFRQAAGLSIVIATHNMEDIAYLADWVYVLVNGRIVADGSPRAVFAQRERLADYGLGVPLTVEVMHRLRAVGLDVRPDALTLEEAAAEIQQLLSSASPNGRRPSGQKGRQLDSDRDHPVTW